MDFTVTIYNKDLYRVVGSNFIVKDTGNSEIIVVGCLKNGFIQPLTDEEMVIALDQGFYCPII